MYVIKVESEWLRPERYDIHSKLAGHLGFEPRSCRFGICCNTIILMTQNKKQQPSVPKNMASHNSCGRWILLKKKRGSKRASNVVLEIKKNRTSTRPKVSPLLAYHRPLGNTVAFAYNLFNSRSAQTISMFGSPRRIRTSDQGINSAPLYH